MTDREFLRARTGLLDTYRGRGMRESSRNLAAVFSRLQATLFYADRVSSLGRPRRARPGVGHRLVSRPGRVRLRCQSRSR